MLYLVIIACEVAFWLLLLAGLALRYGLRLPRAGAAVLVLVPLVDLVLFVVTLIDLRRGGTADLAHGLAAVYLGVSVAFGHRMLRWADQRFSHRYAGGSLPDRPPKYGRQHARHERAGWYRHLVAWAIGCGLLLGGAVLVSGVDALAQLLPEVNGGPQPAEALLGITRTWTLVLLIDFVWSFSYTFWPRGPAPA